MKNIYYLETDIIPKLETAEDSETKQPVIIERAIPLAAKDYMIYEMLNKILLELRKRS